MPSADRRGDQRPSCAIGPGGPPRWRATDAVASCAGVLGSTTEAVVTSASAPVSHPSVPIPHGRGAGAGISRTDGIRTCARPRRTPHRWMTGATLPTLVHRTYACDTASDLSHWIQSRRCVPCLSRTCPYCSRHTRSSRRSLRKSGLRSGHGWPPAAIRARQIFFPRGSPPTGSYWPAVAWCAW